MNELRNILYRLRKGRSQREIACALDLSLNTCRKYLTLVEGKRLFGPFSPSAQGVGVDGLGQSTSPPTANTQYPGAICWGGHPTPPSRGRRCYHLAPCAAEFLETFRKPGYRADTVTHDRSGIQNDTDHLTLNQVALLNCRSPLRTRAEHKIPDSEKPSKSIQEERHRLHLCWATWFRDIAVVPQMSARLFWRGRYGWPRPPIVELTYWVSWN